MGLGIVTILTRGSNHRRVRQVYISKIRILDSI